MNKITHINATSLNDAVSALGSNAAVIAGGTDIYGALKGFIYPNPPDTLVNIKTIPDLDYITEEGGMLKIGTLALLADIAESSVVQSKWSSLAEAARLVGCPQLRNMGTIGGNLCQDTRCWYYRAEQNGFMCFRKGGTLCYLTAGLNDRHSAILGGQVCFTNSVSDTAIPLTALDATVVTTKRSIPIGDFFVTLGNVLDEDEIVTEIQVPEPASDTKQVFLKWAERKAIDFGEASVAIAVSSSSTRIVLGNVAPVPWRAEDAEAVVAGQSITESIAEAAGEAAVNDAFVLPDNTTDKNSGNAYKVQLTKVLVKRALLA
jgi:xanthine dehydrogenase YagS FAD-binding subunit